MTERPMTYKRSLYDKYRSEIKFDVLFGAITTFLLLVVLAFVIVFNFVFVKVYIQGSSMYPTLKEGEIVLLNTYRAPDYGDIIVISGEKSNGDWLIKRAIAFGGDTVKIEGGYVYLKKSGETDYIKLDEPYLSQKGITYYPNVRNKYDILPFVFDISDGEIFYLGDNRTNSSDSRSGFGTCDRSQIVGVVSEFALKTKGINTFFGQIISFINGIFS